MIKLFTQEIKDEYIRENFLRVESYIREEPFRKGNFRFFEIVTTVALTQKRIAHNLTFQPLDVIFLSVRKPDTATVTWHYDSFDRESFVISTSGACTIRAYIGRYGEA